MKKKILLVEDELPVLEVLEEFFSLLGLEIVSSRNGEEALIISEKEGPFDLYVIDIRLPQMDGFTLAQKIRQKDKETPILFLSGYVDQEIRDRAKEISDSFYLTKPTTFKELKETLNKLGIIS